MITKTQRMLVVSDLHLDDNSADVVLGQVLPGCIELATYWECPIIAILGDVYHLRYRLSVRLQNALADLMAGTKITWAMLPGNHDQVDVAGRNALELLGGLSNVKVFTDPCAWNGVHWVPYRHDLAQWRAAVTWLNASGTSKTLAMHGGIRGALQNNHIADEGDLHNDFFGTLNYRLVMSGHYHKPQSMPSPKGNEKCAVLYVGSPYQTRADEATQDKYVYVHEHDKLTALPVKWGNRYHRFVASGLDDLRAVLRDVDVKDDVRITCARGVDMQAAHALLKEQGLIRFQLTPEPEAFKERMQLQPDAGLREHAATYAQALGEEGSYDRLMKRFVEIADTAKHVQGGGLL